MIVKSTARRNKLKPLLSIEARRRAMTRALVKVMEYCTDERFGLQLVPERERSAVSSADLETLLAESDAQVDEATRALLAYTLSRDEGEKLRAVRTRCLWGHEEADIDVLEFTERAVVLMADADPSHLRHVIFADPDANLDQIMTYLRLLYGPAASISITQHGDTQHPHFHAVILTVDPATGKGFQINKGYDIEALHMLAAVIDFENDTNPETNALFLADETAIFDHWTGAPVASRQFEVDPIAAKSVRLNRQKIMATNEAVDHADERWLQFLAETKGLEVHGPEWDDTRVAKLLVAPRIQRAGSWDELHDSLAMVGVRYVQYRGNGRLLLGDNRQLAASDAISTASMTELRRRFGEPYQPPSRPELLRPFICPRFTMGDAEKSDAKARADAKAAVDLEAKRIAEQALEELQAMQRADRDRAERHIRKVAKRAKADHAKRSKLNDNRRKAEQASDAIDQSATAQPDVVAWQLDHMRLHQTIDVFGGYTRTRNWGGQQWYRNGNLEFVEYRTFITTIKGADKLQVLRLAQLKWGEDFKMFGSKREVAEYCRLGAKHGIMFGDESQRAMITGIRLGMAPSALSNAGADNLLYERIDHLRNLLYPRLVEARRAFEKLVVNRESEARNRTRSAAPVDPTLSPNDRRAMIRVQKVADHPDEVIRDYEKPVGQSVPWLTAALSVNPEDLDAPRLQGWLLAESHRQQAERHILLGMLAKGDATIDEGRVVSRAKGYWISAALRRENDNPEFLEKVASRWVESIESKDPDIQAYISARSPDPLHDLTIARQELGHRLLLKAGKQGKRSAWFDGLLAAEKLIVEEAMREAPSTSPTFVIDKTLIKNMTPAERAMARKQQR